MSDQKTLLLKEEYALMAARENFYWWHIGRRKILESALGRYLPRSGNKILDVGCGGGGNILFLNKFGSVVGLDPAEEALVFCKDQGFKDLKLGLAEEIPYNDESFDLVTAFDVLEHLPDDGVALKEMTRVSKKLIMVTVPAMPFLWSAHDVYLGHRRRYRKKDLVKKFEQASLKIMEASYFITPTAPMIILRRTLERVLRRHNTPHSFDIILPGWLNGALVLFLNLEKQWLKLLPLPWGSSLYIIAQKNNHDAAI